MNFVYVIYNRKHDKFYIGQTENLSERLKLHSEGAFKRSYTARFDGGWDLIYHEAAEGRKEALIREGQLKSYQGRKFVKNLIATLAQR